MTMPDKRDHGRDPKPVLDALRHVMGNLCCLSLGTLVVCWNIRGPGSSALADRLGRQHREVCRALDALAVVVRALGAPVIADEQDGVLTREERMQLSFASRSEALGALDGAHRKLEDSLAAAGLIARSDDWADIAHLLEQCAQRIKHHRVEITRESAAGP